jgi:D-arabinose 5-phosphate isomerase GutQ
VNQAEARRLARESLEAQAGALLRLGEQIGDSLWTAAEVIGSSPGIVWTTGVGTSSAVALRLAHVLTDCGVRSMFLSPDLGLHGHSGAMAPGEVLVSVSRGGQSEEVNMLTSIARARGLKTVGLLHDEGSALAKLCDVVIPARTPAELELGGYCATTSSLAASAVCDALCALVLKMTGYTAAQLRETHPGGAVGRALSGDGSEDSNEGTRPEGESPGLHGSPT